jgi:hypothetical protein
MSPNATPTTTIFRAGHRRLAMLCLASTLAACSVVTPGSAVLPPPAAAPAPELAANGELLRCAWRRPWPPAASASTIAIA